MAIVHPKARLVVVYFQGRFEISFDGVESGITLAPVLVTEREERREVVERLGVCRT